MHSQDIQMMEGAILGVFRRVVGGIIGRIMDIDTLSTRRLLLRAFTDEDIKPLHRILNNPAIHLYMPRRDPWPIDKVQKWVEMGLSQWLERGYGWWAVNFFSRQR